jgi:RNA polymerase sigma factor (sigma-70 family)
VADVTDSTMRIARQAARKTAQINRWSVEVDDIFQTLMVWALENESRVNEWAEMGREGNALLYRSLANEAQRFVLKERAAKSRVNVSDYFFYSVDVLMELLKDVWDYAGWTDAAPDQSQVGGTRRPSEGGNRLAMLSDVSSALKHLSESDDMLLYYRFGHAGHSIEETATALGITEEAARKRVERALRRLQDQLGGEPPQWRARRKVKSNAAAQAETSAQEGGQ